MKPDALPSNITDATHRNGTKNAKKKKTVFDGYLLGEMHLNGDKNVNVTFDLRIYDKVNSTVDSSTTTTEYTTTTTDWIKSPIHDRRHHSGKIPNQLRNKYNEK